MRKYNVVIVWAIIAALLDKALSDTYIVVVSLIIIYISSTSTSNVNNKCYSKQNIAFFILGVVMFIGGGFFPCTTVGAK